MLWRPPQAEYRPAPLPRLGAEDFVRIHRHRVIHQVQQWQIVVGIRISVAALRYPSTA